MMRLGMVFVCGVLLGSACHAPEVVAPEQVEGPFRWGARAGITKDGIVAKVGTYLAEPGGS